MEKVILTAFDQQLIVCPELGGSVLAYNRKINGEVRAILRDACNATDVLEASNFPLVPFSNRIRNAVIRWQNEDIQLPQNFLPETSAIHGHGWQAKWQVTSQTKTKLVISYRHDAEQWPFSYIAEQAFELTASGLTHSLSIKNVSDGDMPAGLGFHPYFYRTPKARVSMGVQQMWAVDGACLPTELVAVPEQLTSATGREVNSLVIDNCLTGFNKKANLIWPEWDVKAQLTASEHCDFVVVYSPENEDFYCVEPVTHCTDAFNMSAQGTMDTGNKVLAAGEQMTIWMKLDVI